MNGKSEAPALPALFVITSQIRRVRRQRKGHQESNTDGLNPSAKTIGIDVLQIDGWDVGGVDRNYPDYRPDPRLGTVDELRTALAECHRLGVDVLLFVNLQWANIETEEYRHELHRYAVKDPAGNARNGMRWEYNTTLGLMLQCESHMVMMNPSHPRFQELILDRGDMRRPGMLAR